LQDEDDLYGWQIEIEKSSGVLFNREQAAAMAPYRRRWARSVAQPHSDARLSDAAIIARLCSARLLLAE